MQGNAQFIHNYDLTANFRYCSPLSVISTFPASHTFCIYPSLNHFAWSCFTCPMLRWSWSTCCYSFSRLAWMPALWQKLISDLIGWMESDLRHGWGTQIPQHSCYQNCGGSHVGSWWAAPVPTNRIRDSGMAQYEAGLGLNFCRGEIWHSLAFGKGQTLIKDSMSLIRVSMSRSEHRTPDRNIEPQKGLITNHTLILRKR